MSQPNIQAFPFVQQQSSVCFNNHVASVNNAASSFTTCIQTPGTNVATCFSNFNQSIQNANTTLSSCLFPVNPYPYPYPTPYPYPNPYPCYDKCDRHHHHHHHGCSSCRRNY